MQRRPMTMTTDFLWMLHTSIRKRRLLRNVNNLETKEDWSAK